MFLGNYSAGIFLVAIYLDTARLVMLLIGALALLFVNGRSFAASTGRGFFALVAVVGIVLYGDGNANFAGESEFSPLRRMRTLLYWRVNGGRSSFSIQPDSVSLYCWAKPMGKRLVADDPESLPGPDRSTA